MSTKNSRFTVISLLCKSVVSMIKVNTCKNVACQTKTDHIIIFFRFLFQLKLYLFLIKIINESIQYFKTKGKNLDIQNECSQKIESDLCLKVKYNLSYNSSSSEKIL